MTFAIACVEIVDQAHRQLDQRVGVVFQGTRSGVGKIGEQAKVKIGIWIRKKADFQVVHKFADLLLVNQQGWYRNQCAVFGGDAAAEIQLGQRLRFEDRSDEIVE